MKAICTIRPQPNYRRDAFLHGLSMVGYRLVENGSPDSKDDLLVIWNRYGSYEDMADRWESAGGTVLVAENGYIGEKDGQVYGPYAISISQHHNPIPNTARASKIEFKPWREDGNHVLICAQRGIGSRRMASPPDWHRMTARILKTDRPIRIREHPGNKPAAVPLIEDLRDAWACVVWSSNSGVRALAEGIPVFYDAPNWIGSCAALPARCDLERPLCDDELRRCAFESVAGGQWSVEEISAGLPFIKVLENNGHSLPGQRQEEVA